MVMTAQRALGESRRAVLHSQSTTIQVKVPGGLNRSAAVIVISGMDGWHGLTAAVGDQLSEDGYTVIGLDARSYLIEATRLSGSLTPAVLAEDLVMVLHLARGWFPEAQQTFLLGIFEGAGLSIVAAADRRVGAQLTGVLAIDTPGAVPLRSPFWAWTSWITHREVDGVSVPTAAYVAAVAPTPLSLIDRTYRSELPSDTVDTLFARGGEPRRLALVESRRPEFNDARDQLFGVLRSCLEWSTHVSPIEFGVTTRSRVAHSGGSR
ncbi:MAG: AcvB/VirJ family lysyl-phosphatidylglycerol hydrolase [Acidobacteriota bacterium]